MICLASAGSACYALLAFLVGVAVGGIGGASVGWGLGVRSAIGYLREELEPVDLDPVPEQPEESPGAWTFTQGSPADPDSGFWGRRTEGA